MKAKYVYENIFVPKSKEDIANLPTPQRAEDLRKVLADPDVKKFMINNGFTYEGPEVAGGTYESYIIYWFSNPNGEMFQFDPQDTLDDLKQIIIGPWR